jgi:uracil-DNA glycosylase
MVHFGNDWDEILKDEFEKTYYKELRAFLKGEYSTQTIYPDMNDIFSALKASSFEKTKVVIIGQDPYHDVNQANGLCFSVRDGIPFPPSLLNIFKEIENDLGTPIPASGDLSRWAHQGVLLLNSTLTVRAHSAGSHQNKGWEQFTDEVILQLAQRKENLVFILWGAYAIKKGAFINRMKHLVLTSPHPSPLSAYRGFFGNKHFSLTNEYLVKHGKQPIEW